MTLAPSRPAAILAALLCLLPFEPRRPKLALPGFQVTLLELIAGVTLLVLVWTWRSRLPVLLRRPPPALFALVAFALVNLLSAALAADNPELALKFALRMCAMTVCAIVVAAAPRPAVGTALRGLLAAGLAVAVLSIVEGCGLRALDAALDLFREMPFNVAGVRRASAGSEYPNQAAAFQMAALLAWAGLSGRTLPWKRVLVAAVLSTGILFTYSRGALASGAIGLVAASVIAARYAKPALRRSSLQLLAALGASIAAFAGSTEVFRLRLGSEGTERWYDVRYAPADATLRLEPLERRVLRLSVTNAGRKTWSRRQAFHLSYHWYDPERKRLEDGGRTDLPRDLEPGESASLQAEVVAPDRPGRYLLVWDMVHEDTTWFSGQGVRPAVVPAAVGLGAAEPLASLLPPGLVGWRPGRAELWRLALEIGRERPLLGVGPDNFRWLYGRYAGQSYWDTRVFANNTPLEVFATTGALGVATLLATWLGAFTGAARSLRLSTDAGTGETAVALFALLAGLAAHGAVDYLLAFTGHYLLLGFAIGASAAAPKDPPQTDLS